MSPPSQNAPAASRTNPFNNMAASTGDPFGMGSFNPSSSDLDQQIKAMDKELLDLEVGGSSIGMARCMLDHYWLVALIGKNLHS